MIWANETLPYLGIINFIGCIILFRIIIEFMQVSQINHTVFPYKNNLKWLLVLVGGVLSLLLPNTWYFSVSFLVTLIAFKITRRQRAQFMNTQSFYKIYKYLQIQLETGARPEEIFKSLYRVVDYPAFRASLLQFSVIISQSHDVHQGLNYLKNILKDQEGKLFISITENLAFSGGEHETFSRLNHLLFQKYLSNIRESTKKIKRMYLYSVILFTLLVSVMLLMPLIDQMLRSAQMIFN